MISQTKFFSIIIGILIAIIVAQRVFTPTPECPQTIELRVDTVYNTVSKTFTKTVKLAGKDTTYHVVDTMYLVDTNCEVTKSRFLKLVKQHVTRNIYKDTLTIDSIGHVYIIDTVQFNKLEHRKYTYKYSIPTVTITKIIPPARVRQLYVGGGIDGTYINKTVNITAAKAGVLYKTKKDQLYGATVGVSTTGYLTYGLQSYWKIKLKK
jgi:hypothetical protein